MHVSLQNGLYSSFIGSFVYVIFGSAKDITLGPSAVASLLTALFATSPIPNDPSVSIVLAFFAGFIYIAMFLLGLGKLQSMYKQHEHIHTTHA